jgi:hypothetical protein
MCGCGGGARLDVDQLRAVDKSRLAGRMGRIEDAMLSDALEMLRWIFSP